MFVCPPPENTRMRILEAAYEEMYVNGFQGLRIEAILQKTQLAKGALYHYFPSKLSIGYAVVDEIVLGHFLQVWQEFLKPGEDPLQGMKNVFMWKAEFYQTEKIFNGCPCNNLIQEMAAIDDGFKQRLQNVMMTIHQTVCQALIEGQSNGFVKKDIDPNSTTLFLFSSYQGIMGTAKCMQAPNMLKQLFSTLNSYLDTLRP
ncbi:MAG: TetR/AcrR family transcriptional regulator [Cellvibrio sp.]|jgi:AcrR family transcriptional regulator|nr:TetR/AcrR family transcriptional regulator [Cellvibrio sp.]